MHRRCRQCSDTAGDGNGEEVGEKDGGEEKGEWEEVGGDEKEENEEVDELGQI